jgi:hypothetical protein
MDNVRTKAGDRKFDTVTFVWMLGEADGQAGWGAVYGKSFLGIIDQLKADLKRDDIRFVLGRINDYGGDDPKSRAWVAFPSTQNTVELMVDLDKPQAVSAFAINLLVHPTDGIGFPAKAEITTSKDGENFEAVPTHRNGGFTLQPKRLDVTEPDDRLLLFDIDRPHVRFIKISLKPANSALSIDEIVVNPQPKAMHK